MRLDILNETRLIKLEFNCFYRNGNAQQMVVPYLYIQHMADVDILVKNKSIRHKINFGNFSIIT